MKETTKGTLGALFYSLSIGLAFLFLKLSLGIGNPSDILAHRFLFAFVVIFIMALIKKEPLFIKRSEWKSILPLAFFFPTLFFTLQAFGMDYTATSEAGIIQALIPIFTMILASIFLKEKNTVSQKLFILLSVVGVVAIFIVQGNSGENSHPIGIILITLSCLSFAIYSVIARKETQKYSVFRLTYVMTLMGFVVFNIMAIGNHLLNPELGSYWAPLINPMYIISILYMGLAASLASSYLANYSLSKIDAAKMSVFGNLSIVITIFAGVIFLQEPFSLVQIIGTVIIIVGVIGANISKKKK